MDTAAAGTFRNDAKVIGVIAAAHWTSHFLQLALPPLFVLLRAEFGVSFAALGVLSGAFYTASGISQFGAGFAVDRFGARPVLLAGTALLALSTIGAGLVPAFGWLYVLAVLMGLGNGVFHPADFAILNASVTPRRLGHAFSTHGLGGTLGYAAAPICSYALGSAFGWRTALLTMGTMGLLMLGMLFVNRRDLMAQSRAAAAMPAAASNLAIFLQRPVLLCFVFFALFTMAVITVQTFAAPALHAAYGVPMALATSAITAYLVGNAAGTVTGGFLVTTFRRPDRLAAIGVASGALLMLLCGLLPAPGAALLPLFAAAGFMLGTTGPSRDMLVRQAAPAGATGRTYGFVYSGLDLGATIGPVIAGVLLDHDAPRLVFAGIALVLVLGIATVLDTQRRAVGTRPVVVASGERP